MTHWETIWQFKTANFCVTCDVAPEKMDPADSFCCQDDIDAVRTGAVDWFMVRVQVSLGANVLGEDYLGGCAYRNASDFARGADRDGYFRDMVRAAIGDAKKETIHHQAFRLPGSGLIPLARGYIPRLPA